MTVYLDLDGPLLDVSRRYHAVYGSILAEMGAAPARRDVYWGLKRSGLKDTEICELLHPEVDPAAYRPLFLERIESPRFLRRDRAAPGALEALRALRPRHRLVLATLRRRGRPMLAQLRRLGIGGLVAAALQREDNAGSWLEKAEMITGEPCFRRDDAILVGDTESDARAAGRAEIPCLLVCSGLRARAVLAAWGPERLLESIAELPSRLPPRAEAGA